MERTTTAALLLAAAAVVVTGVGLAFLQPGAVEPPVLAPPAEKPTPVVAPPSGPELPSAPIAESDAAPRETVSWEPSGLDPEDLLYPEGLRGPVVVGAVAMAGDRDPDAWIALESLDDPRRPDPSKVETLAGGGFRLTGFPPGRYRVRARMDGAMAAYSPDLATIDGAVTDAGLLRLRLAGSISGVVIDPDGEFGLAKVRLFGRDSASLQPRVVETALAVGRQGFQLQPHEAGPFRLAVEGEKGYATVAAKTDGAGLAWVEVRLKRWGRIVADVPPGSRVEGIEADPLEVPDLGTPRVRSAVAKGALGPLPAGRYRVKVTWVASPSGEAKATVADATVVAGEDARVAAR